MQKTDLKFSNLKTGLTVSFGIIIFFLFFFVIGSESNSFSETYKLKSIVHNVHALSEGAMVTLGGLKIGRVSSISFYHDNHDNAIEIEMEIEKKFQRNVSANSLATIKTVGMLGDKFIDISIATYGSNYLQEGEFIKMADPFSLENILEKLDPLMNDLGKTIYNLRKISENLSSDMGVLGSLLVDRKLKNDMYETVSILKTFSFKLNRKDNTLGSLAGSNDLYNKLNQTAIELAQLTSKIQAGQGTLGKLVTEDSLYRELSLASANLNLVLQKANNDTTVAGAIINDRALLIKVNTVIAKMDTLITDIKLNPKRYINLSLF